MKKLLLLRHINQKKVKDDIINNKFFNIYNVEIGESQFKKNKNTKRRT